MAKIAPSILSADFSRLGQEISNLGQVGADLIHIDIMDGHFVPNITFGPSIVNSMRGYSTLPFDVHLMISNPEQYIHKFAQSGSDLITIHAETTAHLDRLINVIKSFGKKVGVALNPATPLESIEYVVHYLDVVLIMSVNPGFGGQKFIPATLNKIRKLKEVIIKNDLKTEIEVDGGINLENADEIIRAGADILVAGSAVFQAKNRKEVIHKFKNI